MTWWRRRKPAPIDHAANHDALRIVEKAMDEAWSSDVDCHWGWSRLLNVKLYLKRACNDRWADAE